MQSIEDTKQPSAHGLKTHCEGRVSRDSDIKRSSEKLPPVMAQTNGPVSAADNLQSPEDIAMSKRVNLKMDVALLPLLSLIYLFNGLDRSNVGNAETQGMC